MKSHTPGPWQILSLRTNGKTYVVTDALSQPFTGHVIASPTTCPAWEFNAHLIASAPDLLAALNRLIQSLPEDSNEYPDSASARQVFDSIEFAREAISKATGGVA